ncbi:uncharacterized protein LOC117123878 isoform X2 [Anneissia japonica]|uniref:uncharacterized protein LOC117123878 isoform X2 n=1 Tax=Anneissia japonica TaxID=1529436 RepID=UPI0014258D16|nr:uncharacterized protein LOC117123878 isoform X2 [Anneissia japonica]
MEPRMRPGENKDKPRSKTPDPNWESSRQRIYSEGVRHPADDSHRAPSVPSEFERNPRYQPHQGGPSIRDEGPYGRLGEGGRPRPSYGDNNTRRGDQYRYGPANDYRSLPPNVEPPYRQPDPEKRRTLEHGGQSVYDTFDAVRGRPPPPQYKPPEQRSVLYESTRGKPGVSPQPKESPVDPNIRGRTDMYAARPAKNDLHKSRSAEEVRALGSNRSFDGQSRPMDPGVGRPDPHGQIEQTYGTRSMVPPQNTMTSSNSWNSDDPKSSLYEQGRRSVDPNDPSVRQQYQGENQPPKPKPRIVPSEEELGKLNKEELVRQLRKLEIDRVSSASDNGAKMKEINRRMQSNLTEIRDLREAKEKLDAENKELRDLCYFLDDGRQKERKLAREWQRFGRYTANVMRNEVAVYQNKLQELADRQEELIVENLDLKDVCMMLDEEKTGSRSSICSQCNGAVNSAPRDQGDGSYDESSPVEGPKVNPLLSLDNSINNSNQTAIYIRELELRVKVLEEEKRQLAKLKRNGQGDGQDPDIQPSSMMPHYQGGGKTDAVANAFKVLEVHEQIDDRKLPVENESMSDKERAIVREMCNVVWRKLEDQTEVPAHQIPPSYPPVGRPKYGGVEQPK